MPNERIDYVKFVRKTEKNKQKDERLKLQRQEAAKLAKIESESEELNLKDEISENNFNSFVPFYFRSYMSKVLKLHSIFYIFRRLRTYLPVNACHSGFVASRSPDSRR
jgi:hypothetical protein